MDRTATEASSDSGGWSRQATLEETEAHFGMDVPDKDTMFRLQRLEAMNTTERVRGWVDEGMTIEDMGNPLTIEAFRERQAERPPEVPTNIERQNKRSVQRSEKAASKTGPSGETGVPDSVRDVISSTGQSLDASIQRAMEDRMGDSFGDVQVHTGPTAASACESINARAFTVGNHVAFNQGEYDPESPEGQHVLAHELAHVRQQTGGAVSMLPQEGLELEIDPDPQLEREAEATAQQVMQGGELGIQRMAATEVHLQRYPGQERVEQAREQITERLQDDQNNSVSADPEDLAKEVEEIKQRQEQMMETLTTAQPGAATDGEWGKAATKGVVGSLASAGTGALLGAAAGSVIPGIGTTVGAVTGAAVSDVMKETVEFMDSNRPGGKGEELEQMYQEISRMYQELKEGSANGGESYRF
ncbi:eCIS core domain-containing protein [Halohasta litchfieldiae]|uniref:eCIS core domain-containing protein n=1 Tax=Halohasta litchfieldiae TaxID=1073996 RepID=UPI001FE1ED1C|nr:DUF4157 domain-containing protein [Halohasta litchfieldiae]